MSSHRVRDCALRAAIVPAASVSVLAWASPALAAGGGWRGSGLTALQTLGVLVGAPIALFLIIALLFVLLPAWIGESHSRSTSGLIWTPEAVWFDGPEDEQGSLQVAEPSQNGGGASASW